ncbi:hypothetical protein LTR85_005525 [Meristemomyces frigidus]|nr:hypothetical protein LTR85_005525 [Meristemomyces frigidus]
MAPNDDLATLQGAYRQLQLENDRLKDENDILKASSANPHVAVPPNEPQAFRFLDLPKDVRLMIYDLCLIRGDVTLRCPVKRMCMDPMDSRHPEKVDTWGEVPRSDVRTQAGRILPLQIFQVNKQLYDEALPTFLSKNHFIIPYDQEDFPQFTREGHTFWRNGSFAYNGMAKRYIRSSSIGFHFSPTGDGVQEAIERGGYYDREDGLTDEDAEDERTHHVQRVHDEVLESVLDCAWTWLKDTVKCLKLKYLEVDLTDCYCSFGCHRLVRHVLEDFGNWEQGLPDVVQFIGTSSAAERDWIRESVLPLVVGGKVPAIRFRNYRESWDGTRMKPHWYDPEREGAKL